MWTTFSQGRQDSWDNLGTCPLGAWRVVTVPWKGRRAHFCNLNLFPWLLNPLSLLWLVIEKVGHALGRDRHSCKTWYHARKICKRYVRFPTFKFFHFSVITCRSLLWNHIFISFIIKFWILLNGKRIGHALFVMFKVPSHGGTLSTYKQNQIYLKYE